MGERHGWADSRACTVVNLSRVSAFGIELDVAIVKG